jgi:hypothetical protein
MTGISSSKSAKNRPSRVGSFKNHWAASSGLHLALSAFFQALLMLTLRPIELQQQEARAPLHSQAHNAPSLQSGVRVRAVALAFIGMLCATVISFVSEIRSLKQHSSNYGYDEALGTESSSLSGANFLSNCSNDSRATVRASKDGLDGLGVSAIAAHPVGSPTASFTSRE